MIRKYRDSDFEDVSFLNRISYSSPCTDSTLKSMLRNPSWVVDIGGQVIGALITCPEVDPQGLQPDRDLLWSITVASAQQNKGWGSALIREASKHFRELWLYTETRSPARRLYSREGFLIEKVLEDFYGTGQNAYLMRKSCV